MARDLDDQLTKYLTDAHGLEVQALAQLREAPDLIGTPVLAQAFRSHLAETEQHERTVRELLEHRDATPSRVKDAVLGVGGKGFVLFARLQPDTPGKLFAHALAYEALELASYELLASVARTAGDDEVLEAAEQIAAQERAMMTTLEGSVEAAVDAALADHPRDDLEKLIPKYVADAHAIERQSIGLLERAPGLIDDPELATVFSDHLDETRDQAELLEERLVSLDAKPSLTKDAAMRLGALSWSSFFQAHPDTPGKLTAFAYAFEHLEIGGYEELRLVAARADDTVTVALATQILEEERVAATRLQSVFGVAAAASLRVAGAAG